MHKLDEEILRRDKLRFLRRAFLKRCLKHKKGSGACASAFDKWHFAAMRRSEKTDDPLLPANLSISDLLDTERVMADELVSEGLDRTSADGIAAWHRKQYVKKAKALSKLLRRQGSAEDEGAAA